VTDVPERSGLAAQAEFDSPEGTTPLRLTGVLHLEHGELKLVQRGRR